MVYMFCIQRTHKLYGMVLDAKLNMFSQLAVKPVVHFLLPADSFAPNVLKNKELLPLTLWRRTLQRRDEDMC